MTKTRYMFLELWRHNVLTDVCY